MDKKDQMRKRIREAKRKSSNESKKNSLNCRGTSFYVTGILKKERYVGPEEAEKILKEYFKEIKKPQNIGDLIVIRQKLSGRYSGKYGSSCIGVFLNNGKFFVRDTTGGKCNFYSFQELLEEYSERIDISYYRKKSE